jgi:hypothetical protein
VTLLGDGHLAHLDRDLEHPQSPDEQEEHGERSELSGVGDRERRDAIARQGRGTPRDVHALGEVDEAEAGEQCRERCEFADEPDLEGREHEEVPAVDRRREPPPVLERALRPPGHVREREDEHEAEQQQPAGRVAEETLDLGDAVVPDQSPGDAHSICDQ